MYTECLIKKSIDSKLPNCGFGGCSDFGLNVSKIAKEKIYKKKIWAHQLKKYIKVKPGHKD